MSLLSPKTIVITAISGKQPVYRSMNLSDNMDEEGEPKKRRRLTHLSAEEKMLRRKLKNRVAAQTARDRKKAQMSDLEIKIAKLESENKKLQTENKLLKTNSTSLVKENEALKERLGQVASSVSVSCGRVSKSEPPRSAAPADPLPKEQIQALSHVLMMHYAAFSLTLSLMFCLVCSSNSKKGQQASSRKRKQAHPARCPTMLPEQPRPSDQWWGRHQQNWNPSMN